MSSLFILTNLETQKRHLLSLSLVLKVKLNVLALGLLGKQCVDVVDEAHHVGFAHVHLHLSLVNLSQVHHLVDESENTLGITTDGFVNCFAAGIVVVLDKREQRCGARGQ